MDIEKTYSVNTKSIVFKIYFEHKLIPFVSLALLNAAYLRACFPKTSPALLGAGLYIVWVNQAWELMNLIVSSAFVPSLGLLVMVKFFRVSRVGRTVVPRPEVYQTFISGEWIARRSVTRRNVGRLTVSTRSVSFLLVVTFV